jgi:hypothetical protein
MNAYDYLVALNSDEGPIHFYSKVRLVLGDTDCCKIMVLIFKSISIKLVA